MSKIFENIWIAGFEEVYNTNNLAYIRPTHILNCTDNLRIYYGETPVITHRIPLEDDETDDVNLIEQGADKLEEWLKEGAKVIVHCAAGISRSPAVVIAWMIKYKGYTFDSAYMKVAKERDFIRPNRHYCNFLKKLQSIE